MPHTMRLSVLAAMVVALASSTGCANGRVSEQDDVRGTVRTFLDQCAQDRVLNVLPTLVPAAQKVVAHAGSLTRGCSRILRLDAGTRPTAPQFAGSRVRVVHFDGALSRVAVDIGGQTTSVVLSRGTERWRIECP
jgi:hypothetical protein